MDIKDNTIVNKLILLFFMDKMDVPLNESSVLKACYYENPWLEYLDCISTLNQLEENGFLCKSMHDKTAFYSITPDGRSCIANFYTRIPASVRQEITEFVKENRLLIRRRQEYYTSYQLNPDHTYTVILKIIDPTNPNKTTMDLRFVVSNKEIAKNVSNKWNLKAAEIYKTIFENLVDE